MNDTGDSQTRRAGDSQTRFPRLPLSFTDEKGRSIDVETYTDGPIPLVEMYEQFDSGSQFQGVPPRTRTQIEEWVTDLLENGLNVVASHEGRLVGHAVLLPYNDTSELAIFVDPAYQSAGIGTRLIRGLLGYGRSDGVEHVWLSVSRDNRIAMRLYKSAGFEVRNEDRGEYELERDI